MKAMHRDTVASLHLSGYYPGSLSREPLRARLRVYKRQRRRVCTLAESGSNSFDWFGLFKPKEPANEKPAKPQDDGKFLCYIRCLKLLQVAWDSSACHPG